jgi:protocatechuate 3,4-dioxygenase beta subunit
MARRLLIGALASALVVAVYFMLRRDQAAAPELARPAAEEAAPAAAAHAPAGQARARTAVAGADEPSDAAASRRGNATVAGRVLDLVSGAPIVGAEVSVTAAAVSAAALRASPATGGARSETGADGTFQARFEHRADAAHWIQATHGDYLCGIRMLGDAELRDAAHVAGFDFALVPASHGARLIGRVVDAQGAAVGQARVGLLGSDDGAHPERGWRFESEAATDGDGRFAIARVAPGTLRLLITCRGFTPLARTGLELAAGSLTDLGALVLHPDADAPAPTAILRGSVTDDAGRAVDGALVSITGSWSKSSEVEPGGAYRIEGIPAPNELTVRFTAPGWPEFTFVHEFSPDEQVLYDHRFAAGKHFVGGTVVDGAAPVAGLEVSCGLTTVVQGRKGRSEWRTTTDAAGQFHLRGLSAGPVDLRLEWPWDRGVYRDLVVRGVAVDRTDHRFRFPLPKPSTIRGTVRATDGSPLAAVTVAPGAGSRGTGAAARAETAADGTFRVELSLSNQQAITLQASRSGYATVSRAFVLSDVDRDRTVNWDLVLARDDELATIAGRVTDTAGKPVASAEGEVRREGRGGRQSLDPTDTDGRYRGNGIIPGAVVLRIDHPTHAPFEKAVVLAAGERATLDVVLEPLAFANVKIVFASSGAPAAGERVAVFPRHAGSVLRAVTDQHGAIDLTRWPLTDATVVVDATPAHPELHAAVRADQLRRGVVRLTLRGGTGVVHGRLQSRDGQPVVAELVTLQARSMQELYAYEEVSTDQEGRFRFDALPEGIYTVGVSMHAHTVEVRPDGPPLTLLFP